MNIILIPGNPSFLSVHVLKIMRAGGFLTKSRSGEELGHDKLQPTVRIKIKCEDALLFGENGLVAGVVCNHSLTNL